VTYALETRPTVYKKHKRMRSRFDLEYRAEGMMFEKGHLRSIVAARMSASHVRRDKAAHFQWVKAPPRNRSSWKQPEQAWRRRNV
jgi:hypothetical protein